MNLKKVLSGVFISMALYGNSFSADFKYLGSYQVDLENNQSAELLMEGLTYTQKKHLYLNFDLDTNDRRESKYSHLRVAITFDQYKKVFESNEKVVEKISDSSFEFVLEAETVNNNRVIKIQSAWTPEESKSAVLKEFLSLSFGKDGLNHLSFESQVKRSFINPIALVKPFKTRLKRTIQKTFTVLNQGLQLRGISGEDMGVLQTEQQIRHALSTNKEKEYSEAVKMGKKSKTFDSFYDSKN
ncbi:hypothetical protein MJH12_17525 [bacterium]|nr:hypothetical protein [bacterium]